MGRVPGSIKERMVFVDTSALLALVAHNDQFCPQATRILEELQSQRYQLFTTIFVVYESHAGILSTVGAAAARAFLYQMGDSGTLIYASDRAMEERAREIIFTYQDKDYSLCDATSFALMERLGTSLAFAFDDHFRQHGFYIPLGQGVWS